MHDFKKPLTDPHRECEDIIIIMSQNQSNSKITSSYELEHFKKPDLQAFLKARGVGSTGNKDVLLKMAKLYAKIMPKLFISN